jgi:hypothetical protein
MFVGLYSGAIDITLAILPWKLLWITELNGKEKIGVGIAMSMGVL